MMASKEFLPVSDYFQRFLAANRAISRRLSGDNFIALALPPLRPPLRANSLAGVSCGASGSVASPIDKSTISFPS
jgi:hypothetical protein